MNLTPTGATGAGKASFAMRHRSVLTAVCLMAAAWLLHLPSVWYGFVYYDDVRILRDHPELYGQPRFADNLRAIFVTAFPREEPLLVRDVSWAVDGQVFGFGNPLGYHLGNVLLHGVVLALMFAFLLGITRRYALALGISVAYLVLAVHTEPVAWIMGRKDILSTIFMLLALCAQTCRLTTSSRGPQWSWYGLTLGCTLLALLSKISTLTFPAVLLLHAVLLPYLRGERPPDAPLGDWRRLFREGLLVLPALAASGVVYVWYQRTLAQMGIFDRGYSARGFDHLWNLVMFNPPALWVYLKQVFLPSHNTVLYTWPHVATSYPGWQVAGSLVTIAAVGAAGIWLFRKRKDLFFYFSAFFVLMVPYLNIVYIGIYVADRYAYFSVFALLAIAGSWVYEASRRPEPPLRLGALAGCLIFLVVNVYQKLSYQAAWRNAETLWQHHIGLPHPSPVAFGNLAAYYYAALQIDPERAGVALQKMNVVVDAGLAEFWPDRKQPPPGDTYYLFFLKAIVQEVTGDVHGALESLLTAERLHSRFDSTKLNLTGVYRKLVRAESDPRRRLAYAQAARDRFAEYVELAFRGRSLPPELARERESIQAEYADLAAQVGRQPPP
jgi:hypothetical protein